MFIYFNYSLKLVSRAKTSKEKEWRKYLINVYLNIKYVAQIERKKIDEQTLFEICNTN